MFDKRLNLPIFLTLSLAALIFIIYADIVFYNNIFRHSVAFTDKISHFPNPQKSEVRVIKSTVISIPLLSIKEATSEDESEEDLDTSVPPFNLSAKARLAWFQKNLPKFRILQSNNLTGGFHRRVLQFLSHGCETQFFMTWISPAKSFGTREFTALESLFKANPRGCLTILSRTMDSPHGYTILKPLLDHGFKILAVTPDLSFLFKRTPAEAWLEELKSGKKDPGEIQLAQNLSNLIRFAVLYKYGGVYLDTDFIVLRSFQGLRNSIGAQSIAVASGNWTRLNNAVLIFDLNHPLLAEFINEFASTFDGNKWGLNGPYLVSRVVDRVGRRADYNVTILSNTAFYPVDWNRIGGLFKKPENRAASRWVNAKLLQLGRESYGIHLWNKQSRRYVIEEESVLARLIPNHCIICKYVKERLKLSIH